MNHFALIIVAAGNSTRMGLNTKKEYMPLNNGTVLSCVALAFLPFKQIEHIVVVIPVNDEKNAKEAFFKDNKVNNLILQNNTKVDFINGGSTRQESVFNALTFLESNSKDFIPDYVLIHDGARPFFIR